MKVELTEEGYTLDGKWKLVPVDATEQMQDTYDLNYADLTFDAYAYSEMIKASPKPDLSGLQSVKGIHVGGEILPEFNSDNGVHY